MGRLFGTDGVRGVANTELTASLAFDIGRAAAFVLGENDKKPVMVIGRDTRISGDMLENALTAGVLSVGGDVIKLGIVPTPAVAYLVRKYNADAGVVISASHNPFEYNGIKLFNGELYWARRKSAQMNSLGQSSELAARTMPVRLSSTLTFCFRR